MSDFLDYEPEDSWDPGDTWPTLADNLLRRVALLEGMTTGAVRGELLDTLIGHRLAVLSRRPLSVRDRLRVDQALEDLAFLRERADHG
jgi:hypothetical protein